MNHVQSFSYMFTHFPPQREGNISGESLVNHASTALRLSLGVPRLLANSECVRRVSEAAGNEETKTAIFQQWWSLQTAICNHDCNLNGLIVIPTMSQLTIRSRSDLINFRLQKTRRFQKIVQDHKATQLGHHEIVTKSVPFHQTHAKRIGNGWCGVTLHFLARRQCQWMSGLSASPPANITLICRW